MSSEDVDRLIRLKAFEHVRRLMELYDTLAIKQLRPGFKFQDKRAPLINPQRGIFKPRQMRYLLSIRTVFPRPGTRIWYDDQRVVHRQIFENAETVDYAFMGQDPKAADNRWLREAFETQTPVIYFPGIAPGRCQAVIPTFIAGWDSHALAARLVFGISDGNTLDAPQDGAERRYGLRIVKQRPHQSSFREAVILAYDGRCAVSRLAEQQLLDAAHIVPDKDESCGQPIVTNGVLLSRIHHTAFDRH